MIPLPLKLRKNGFNYNQVLRGLRSCLYRQRLIEKIDAYEVFKIRIRSARYIQGKFLQAKERFPADEDFGKFAWTYTNFENAKKKYDELEQK